MSLLGLDEIRIPEDETPKEGHGILRELDHSGDSVYSWDPDNEAERNAAKAHFDALRAKGYLAYRSRGRGQRGETMHQFDALAGEIIMAPATVGG